MNVVKRAGLSLVARTGEAALTPGIFLVVGTLLLGGFVLPAASPLVERYNPVLRGTPRAPGLKLLQSDQRA